MPAEIEVRRVRRVEGEALPFTSGDFARVLREESAERFQQASEAAECLILKGEFADPPNLNYLRDTIGMISWMFDHGVDVAVDPQRFRIYGPVQWWEDLFAPLPPKLNSHVVILASSEDGGTRWLHTRGMRKFGRPDISVRGVTESHQAATLELINRLILLQAEGGLVPDGQAIQMRSLPPGLSCHHAGSVDDPDFNNTHLEIRRTRDYSF